jgi:hypothetical protein
MVPGNSQSLQKNVRNGVVNIQTVKNGKVAVGFFAISSATLADSKIL